MNEQRVALTAAIDQANMALREATRAVADTYSDREEAVEALRSLQATALGIEVAMVDTIWMSAEHFMEYWPRNEEEF